MTSILDVRPTPASYDLSLTDLPVGTYIRFKTDKGFVGTSKEQGEITKVGPKTYTVATFYGETSRIGRDAESIRKRSVRAVFTPEEYQAYLAEAKAERERRSAEHQAQQAQEKAVRRLAHSQDLARRVLAERYPEEFDSLVAQFQAPGAPDDLFANIILSIHDLKGV